MFLTGFSLKATGCRLTLKKLPSGVNYNDHPVIRARAVLRSAADAFPDFDARTRES